MLRSAIQLFGVLSLLSAPAFAADKPSAGDLVKKILESDAWGLNGAETTARAVVRDAKGNTRELHYSGRSRKAGQLSKALIRFSAPADLAGVGFLQIQKEGGDDDRHLYLPEIKRSRRIAGNLRKNPFMGTDFSYADLDQRDLRSSAAAHKGEEKLGKFDCWVIEVTPNGADAVYGKLEIWLRKDNAVPIQTKLYAKSGTLWKTQQAQRIERIKGRWYVTRSLMTNHEDKGRVTEVFLDKIAPTDDVPEDVFTVRTLEKS